MSSSQIKKHNLNELSLIFKDKILLNPYRVENLKKFAIEGKLQKELLRPITWKIFLEVLPETTSLKEWVEVISNQREEYKKKLKKYCKIKKIGDDPLGGGKKKKAPDTSYEDNELKELINKDLDRTHQDIDLFLQNKIKNILANVLYIWSKENQKVSYRQGMNELLSIFYLVFYPYYFPCTRKPKNTKDDIIDFLKDINLYKEDIYIFFHDEEEIQSDLFFIFEALMKKGMTNLFDPILLEYGSQEYNKYVLFKDMWKCESEEKNITYIYRRCSLLISEKLKSLDLELYNHFKKIKLNCEVVIQRWLRCMFCREYNLDSTFLIWDNILYNDYINKQTEKYSFIYMEYISIAMIFKIRDKLKEQDEGQCYETLFKYPSVKDIFEIIKLADKVEQAINERLNGKDSNVYDILGIMKPIKSEPAHIFSPHLFNQPNNKNIINNNINKKKDEIFQEKKEMKKNNDYNNETYEQLESDEKSNINLDSINHKNMGNDLGSQAKSFFNSALNSLSNFGGIIKEGIVNAKDTVIDSFTGNNFMNDNYDNNNIQNHDEQNNYSNNNIINTNNTYDDNNNHGNENNDNVINEQKEENEINSNDIYDPYNDISYNRQDILDIVKKLKEMDTRYNMMFNSDDKKNLRIIIDYLKAKL
jgi:hypothetical protein